MRRERAGKGPTLRTEHSLPLPVSGAILRPEAASGDEEVQVGPSPPRFPSTREQDARDGAQVDFARLVRDALRHLHDPVYLQPHPLTRLLIAPSETPSIAGKRLARLLLDAIAALRPGAGSSDARAYRRYDLLTLRYVEALEIDEVSARLAISRREYNREHRQALDAVVSLLQGSAARPARPVPPVATGHDLSTSRLPVPLTGFIGRERERADVHHLLDSVRLVTLTGPPGTGKTRLALQIGMELATSSHGDGTMFPDGISFVPLASIADPELVVPLIAQTLGVREVPNRSLIESLEDYLSDRRTLLILDNFEHLLVAAPVASQLLGACPNLKVLVTSRGSLRLSGEHEFVVSPLKVPEGRGTVSLEELAACEAVALYVERAAAMDSGFRLTERNAPAVSELCRRLDGLPLAIELAAARSRIFPPYALLGRLEGRGDGDRPGSSLTLLRGGPRDLPPRQQTLQSAIDWSYRLLTAEEQRLFARLSVFAGGWTVEAAEAVCAVDGDLDVVEGLASLLDKSLVRQEETADGEPRFGMLEMIRAYALGELGALGDDARTVRRRHAEYCLMCAREGETSIWGREEMRWLGRLNREIGNVRAALAWCRDHGEVELALQLGGALFWFWHHGGHWTEGRAWLESVLAVAGPGHRTEGRAAALNAIGLCNWCLGDFAAARRVTEECLADSRERGDRRGMGHAFHGLGVLASEEGDLARARALIEEGLSLSRVVGDRPFVGLALHQLGTFAVLEGDEATARARIAESQRVWRELGNVVSLSLAASLLGDLARSGGRYAEAEAHYRESLELLGEAGPPGWRADYLHNLGHVTHRLGDDRQARAFFAEALSLSRELGDRRGVAESVAGLACLTAGTQPQRTARLLGSAITAVEAMGSHLHASNRADHEHGRAIARDRLGDEAFEAAWAQGIELPLEQAVADALEE